MSSSSSTLRWFKGFFRYGFMFQVCFLLTVCVMEQQQAGGGGKGVDAASIPPPSPPPPPFLQTRLKRKSIVWLLTQLFLQI